MSLMLNGNFLMSESFAILLHKIFDELELFTIPLHHIGLIKAVFDALEQNIAIKKD